MEIKITNLEYTYMPKTPFEHKALKGINLHIKSGQFVAIIGHTGSGKSTLVQHLNGLLKPTKGSVHIGDFVIEANDKNKKLKSLRQMVGMVFQYPEHQLFDETVEKDISFGPKSFGYPKEALSKLVKEVLPLVGLDESFLEKSPFDLSGGEKRRVAIAGVLASNPKVLVLDEPTAGLDPIGRKQMMELFVTLHKKHKLTTILVTHNMELAAMYADLVVVMDKGRILIEGSPDDVFKSPEILHMVGLDVPETVQFLHLLKKQFQLDDISTNLYTLDGVVDQIVEIIAKEMK